MTELDMSFQINYGMSFRRFQNRNQKKHTPLHMFIQINTFDTHSSFVQKYNNE